jgi:hypothetical protein
MDSTSRIGIRGRSRTVLNNPTNLEFETSPGDGSTVIARLNATTAMYSLTHPKNNCMFTLSSWPILTFNKMTYSA